MRRTVVLFVLAALMAVMVALSVGPGFAVPPGPPDNAPPVTPGEPPVTPGEPPVTPGEPPGGPPFEPPDPR
jgi:hypothetical protein